MRRRSRIIDFARLLPALSDLGATSWAETLPRQVERRLQTRPHGDLARWLAAIESLPVPQSTAIHLDRDAITAESGSDAATRDRIERVLMDLHPWRKGPFALHGVELDAEWRSNLKWRRVAPHLTRLDGRSALDIGCGNGYYLWRMLGAGAKLALGIDPTQLFVAQFTAVRRLMGKTLPAHALPLGVEDLPPRLRQRAVPASSTEAPPLRTDLPYMEARRLWLDAFQRRYLLAILAEHDDNVSAAARAAGLDRRTIQRALARLREDDADEG